MLNIRFSSGKYKILWKLSMLVLAMFFLITLLSLITIYNISLLDKNTDLIKSYNETLALIETLQKKSNDLLKTEREKEIRFDQELVEKYKDFDNYLKQFVEQAKKSISNRELKKALQRINTTRETFTSLLNTTYQAYDPEFDVWDTDEIPMSKLISKRESLHKDIEELLIKNNALINSISLNSAIESKIIVSYMIAIVIVILICLIWFSYYLTKKITYPINHLITAAREIGSGNLDYKVKLEGYDEISELAYTLNQMTESLKKSEERLKSMLQLAVTVAHEVRNPIAGIGNAIQVISSKFSENDPYREIVLEIINQINRVNEIISNLLNYARPVPLNITKCKLRDAILNNINFLKTSGSFNNINLEIDFPTEADVNVNLDTKQFIQSFMNIVINALQAINNISEPKIKIKGYILNDKLNIEITDNGPGISDEIKDKIFEPFFTTKHKGSGLGLAVSQKIIQSMGGEINVKSIPNQETTFTISFPISKD